MFAPAKNDRLALAITLAIHAAACGGEDALCVDGEVLPLTNATPSRTTAASEFVVMLRTPDNQVCSGVIIHPTAILTAAHCIQATSAAIRIELRTGQDADECLQGDCAPRELAVEKHATEDLAVLVSAKPIATPQQVAPLLIAGSVEEFDALGFGVGTYFDDATGETLDAAAGTKLLRGRFRVTHSTLTRLVVRSEGDETRVCSGDSGGPAVADLEGTGEVVVGMLYGSGGADVCTESGGDQIWLRPVRFVDFIEGVIGPCSRDMRIHTTLARCTATAGSCAGDTR